MEQLILSWVRSQVLFFNDPRTDNLNHNQGIPSEWFVHAEALLALPGDLRRHAIVIGFHNLTWFSLSIQNGQSITYYLRFRVTTVAIATQHGQASCGGRELQIESSLCG